jgi:tetrathionate reductase subunit B
VGVAHYQIQQKGKSMNKNPEQADAGRRGFLGAAAAATGATLAPGISLIALARSAAAEVRPPDQPVTDEVRWGMLVDTTKCAEGCSDCITACDEEHGLKGFGRPKTDAQYIRKVNLRNKLTGHVKTLPMMCQHCEHPPCVDVCPTGASFRRADGIVLVDKHICIGCRYCMMACPYKARSFVHEVVENQKPNTPRGKGTVESCTFCVVRVDEGKQPACVEACAEGGHGALVFGDLKDPDSAIAKRLNSEASLELREDLNLNTGVRYQGI